jgi:flagella basal body P-ring formation protein FlgA
MMRKIFLFFGMFLLCAGSALAAGAPGAPAAGTVRIVVPARDIARGEVIADSDLTYADVAGSALMSGTVTDLAALAGMQARRMLHAGEAMRTVDVRRPVVVTRGQTVTMTFEAPGVSLTAMGRAMSEGGVGDSVTVQNPASFRMITAIVTAPGQVRAAGVSGAGALNARAPSADPGLQFSAR